MKTLSNLPWLSLVQGRSRHEGHDVNCHTTRPSSLRTASENDLRAELSRLKLHATRNRVLLDALCLRYGVETYEFVRWGITNNTMSRWEIFCELINKGDIPAGSTAKWNSRTPGSTWLSGMAVCPSCDTLSRLPEQPLSSSAAAEPGNRLLVGIGAMSGCVFGRSVERPRLISRA